MINSGEHVKIYLFSILCLVFMQSSIAQAHGVHIFAWTEGNTIFTESYYNDNKKVINGSISVYDPFGKEILKGNTNERGEFSFKIPQKTDLRIVLTSSMGHGAEYLFNLDESPAGADTLTAGAETQEAEHTATETEIHVSRNEIRKIVEDALDDRLKPLSRNIAELRKEKGPGITEIIGGIGYIFGLMGVVLYLRSKKRHNF